MIDTLTLRALALGSGAARRGGTGAVSDEEKLHESVIQQTASGRCLQSHERLAIHAVDPKTLEMVLVEREERPASHVSAEQNLAGLRKSPGACRHEPRAKFKR